MHIHTRVASKATVRLLLVVMLIAAVCLAVPVRSDATPGPIRPLSISGPAWTTATTLPAYRGYAAVAAGLDGNIYVFGGETSSAYVDTNTTLIYHPISDTWTQGANMPTVREGAQAVTLSTGQIAVLGGGTGGPCGLALCTIYNTVEVYTPSTNKWVTAPPMLTPRYRFAAVLGSDGAVYAIGGFTTGGQAVSSVEAFSSGKSWGYVFSLPQPQVASAAAVSGNGNIVVVGGTNGQFGSAATYYNNVWLYNSQTGWSAGAAMPTSREDLAAATGSDGQVYAIGGYNSSGFLSTVEAYNGSLDSWSSVAPLPSASCCNGAASVIPAQKIYAGDVNTLAMLDLGAATETPTPTNIPSQTPSPQISATPTQIPTVMSSATATQIPTTTTTAIPTSTPGTTVSVPGSQPWTDTGITVSAGQTITITSSGSVSFTFGPGNSYSPAGKAGCVATEAMVAPGVVCYSLVGRIGNGAPFLVGPNFVHQATVSGRLGLGINDGIFSDNSGSFSANITVH